MAPSTQPVDLGILLALAYQEFVRELRNSLARQGFDDQGRSDGYVLRTLHARSMSISELAERLEVTKQGAAQIVTDMQRRGYVERHPDPNDGRAWQLRLTERGTAALAAARRFHRDYERRLVRTHGAEAVTALRGTLAAMATPAQLADPRLRAHVI